MWLYFPCHEYRLVRVGRQQSLLHITHCTGVVGAENLKFFVVSVRHSSLGIRVSSCSIVARASGCFRGLKDYFRHAADLFPFPLSTRADYNKVRSLW
jgi:hypothetical protein